MWPPSVRRQVFSVQVKVDYCSGSKFLLDGTQVTHCTYLVASTPRKRADGVTVVLLWLLVVVVGIEPTAYLS